MPTLRTCTMTIFLNLCGKLQRKHIEVFFEVHPVKLFGPCHLTVVLGNTNEDDKGAGLHH